MQPVRLQCKRSPARASFSRQGHPAGEWLMPDSRAWPSQVLDMKHQQWIPLLGFTLLQRWYLGWHWLAVLPKVSLTGEKQMFPGCNASHTETALLNQWSRLCFFSPADFKKNLKCLQGKCLKTEKESPVSTGKGIQNKTYSLRLWTASQSRFWFGDKVYDSSRVHPPGQTSLIPVIHWVTRFSPGVSAEHEGGTYPCLR